MFDLFEEEDGLDALFGLVRDALPEQAVRDRLRARLRRRRGGRALRQTELQMLQEVRYELDIDRLHGAAIERGARARHMVL